MNTKSDQPTNMNVIVEAKTQYTKQLQNAVKDVICDKIINDYEQVKKHSKPDEIMYDFQSKLLSYKKWNSDDIDNQTKQVVKKCEFLNEIITAVFISNIRILTSVKMNQNKKKMKITIPSNETFIHKLYVNVAKIIYNNIVSFHNVKTSNIRKNDIQKYVNEAIEELILNMLPLKEILDCYIGIAFEEEEEEIEENIEESQPQPQPQHEYEYENKQTEIQEAYDDDDLPGVQDDREDEIEEMFEVDDDVKSVKITDTKQLPTKRRSQFFDDVKDETQVDADR